MKRIYEEIKRYCYSKGYIEGQGVNNFVPHDCVAAFQMAKLLVESGNFDHYIAIAPEGHIYGFFFDLLGAEVLSVLVDYPPTQVKSIEDLAPVMGNRVLLIEDDVISGATLRLVLNSLKQYSPQSVSLYLGHTKGVQHLYNVPDEIMKIYLAEDYLRQSLLEQYVVELETYWKNACQ